MPENTHIEPELSTEERLDELFVKWQHKWTDARTSGASDAATGAINALCDVYAILGLETP